MKEALIGMTRWTLAAAALGIALITQTSVAADAPVGSASPASTAAPAPSPSLYQIVADLARVDAMKREIDAALGGTTDLGALTAPLDESPLPHPFQSLEWSSDPATRVRYMELRALDAHLRERLRIVGEASRSIGSLAQKLVATVERLDRESALWPQRAKLALEAQAPREVQRSVDAVVPELAQLRERLVARRDELLVAYERAGRLQARLESMRASVTERRERLWPRLRSAVSEPMWRQTSGPLPVEELRANVTLMRYDLDKYVARSGGRLALWFVALVALSFLILRRPTAVSVHAALSPPPLPAGAALCAALLVAVACIPAVAPAGAPMTLYRLLFLGFPLIAAVVATRTFARALPATAWTLAFAVFLNEFRIVAEMSAPADWMLLLLQTLPFGIALLHDWRRGALARAFPSMPRLLLRGLVQADALALALALAASFAGYVGFAGVLVALAVIAPGFVLSFAALAWAVAQAFAGLLSLPIAQTIRSVREQPRTILRVFWRFVVLAAWVGGIAALALSYSALDDVLRALDTLAQTSVSAGEVTITLKAVVSALLVVAVTWLVTKFVRFVLDWEILPRLNLRAGVPVAVSTIVGYVLVIVGAVLAMAALGIDLTKLTLVAGALGIGVGLGLQNVVNNFASGLILMLERPINVGDQIDVGGVIGEVKRIGVRSSTIRTLQGAEIIVPNADLASKQVTNWTLSDRGRRYDIDIGVAYGADPTAVLQLLEKAAASVAEVRTKPAPRAAFTGFGDNSLEFRLYAWVDSIDVGIQAQSGLRTAILKALDKAGIDIPFPQRDVRIRYMPEATHAAG
jgi:potassium-dependent mechanosensitive channel